MSFGRTSAPPQTMGLDADTVAERLRDGATLSTALDVLEALAAPIPTATALAAAPALVDVFAHTTEHAALDRAALLLARLLAEAAPEPESIFEAALRGERYAAFWAPDLLVEATQRASTSGQPLTREDARSFACLRAWGGPSSVRGPKFLAAVGGSAPEGLGIVSTVPAASAGSLLARTRSCAQLCLSSARPPPHS
eukprot:COSAG02_NODE_717_length_18070_cov_20.762700_19_plen_196_part_00